MADSETRSTVTRSDIVRGLREVGLATSNTVFAHSSLSAFGFVKGGADAVIDALLEAVGPTGTLALPTFTWGPFHDKEGVVFDVANTPCETGKIPETFRKRAGVVRGTHICHSVAAVGPHALEVIGDGGSSFGKGSSFEALMRLDAWNLFLGVTFTSCTALHMVEEVFEVPYRYYRTYPKSRVILPDGTEEPSRSTEFLRKEGFRNDFAKMERIFEDAGVVRKATVGEATIRSIRIRDVLEVARPHMVRDRGFLLVC